MVAPHRTFADDDPTAAKRAVRRRALESRRRLDPTLGSLVGAHLLRALPPPSGAAVAGFWPLADEIDLRPLLLQLYARGHRIVLPVTLGRARALGFREWWPGQTMEREPFGTLRPTGPERRPDYLLVPLLAFDRTGARLGYGGGYYDRTLAAMPNAMAIGCGWAALEVPLVPTGPGDVRLPAIATERGVMRTD